MPHTFPLDSIQSPNKKQQFAQYYYCQRDNQLQLMGNNVPGSTKIAYTTKDGAQIDYLYYDLKGRNRFPKPRQSDKQIDTMFYQTLKEIQATQQQLEILQDFNTKYRHRFVVQHSRKVQQYREKNELHRLRTSKLNDQACKNIEESRKKELDDKLKFIESNHNDAVKMHLASLERTISQKNMYTEFIKIDGVKRLITLLDKAIATNKQGTNTIFQTQIEILKFLKALSDHNPKQYFSVVSTIRDYAIVLMRAYHPVNIAVTAYVLSMLEEYSWKVENNLTLMQVLRLFKQQAKINTILEPFAETIYHTDNILMCCYNLRFINEMLISIVDEDEKKDFEDELAKQRYEFLIQDIKNKLQDNFFKIDHCTFIAVSQAIYKQATRDIISKPDPKQHLTSRATLNLATLQQHLLVNFVEGELAKENQPGEQQSEEEDNSVTVYLAENDKKSFNKFVLETFAEIQHYYKYAAIVEEAPEEITKEEVIEEIEKIKQNGLSVNQYIKRTKANCIKNACEQILLNCFKSLQYFEKNQWKKLEDYINDGMKAHRSINEILHLKKQIQQKQLQIKLLKKECHDLKTELLNRSNPVNGLPNLPPPPNGLPNLPPPPTGLPNLPPPPTGLPNLPPPPIGLPNLPPPPMGLPNLPPPPMGLPNLPPPPMGLPNLPPPPLGLPNLPPPLGLPNLTPPPIGLPNISMPPPIGVPSSKDIPSLAMPNTGVAVQQKKKPKKQPKVNLKACNYVVLSYQKIKSTIWQKVDDTKVPINQQQLQSLFARVVPKKQQPKASQSSITLTSPTKKNKIKLLGPDKHRNFEIILTKLKLPQNAIAQLLTECMGKSITPSILDSINKILPSEQDQMLVKSYEGNLDDLGPPERFIKEITTIPEYATRLKALIFANNKQQIFHQLQTKTENLTKAFQSLRANKRLHHILEFALALGNYLNGTGIKGGAWGFRLDTIESLQEVTSNDNTTNAGFYLIKQVWKKYSYPIFEKEEIDMYQYVQKMPTSQIKADLGQLKKTITAVEKAAKSKIKNNPKDKIDQLCQQLLAQANKKYTLLQAAVKKMDQAFKQCATFYCEDPNKAASDQIGKKIFKCILFIFTTEKSFYQVEERKKKQQARKMSKIQFKGKDQNQKSNPSSLTNINAQPKMPIGAIKLPMPIFPAKHPATAEERLKQLQKSQQEKEKKLLAQTMKKRSSKMVAFRESRVAGNVKAIKAEQQINFLKGL